MNIEQIAREAGDDWDSTNQKDKDFLAKFASLYRAALVRELVAGSGEPTPLLHEYGWNQFETVYAFTRDQLAGAVAREHDRIAELEAALDVALEALESANWYIGQLEPFVYTEPDVGVHEEHAKVRAAIAKLKEMK